MSICGVCKHPKVHIINDRLLGGVQCSALASEFGFSKDQLFRHKRDHISGQIAKRVQYVEQAASVDMLEKIDRMVTQCEDIFQRNYEAKKDLIAIKALAEKRGIFELLAKISFQLHEVKRQELELERIKAGEFTSAESMQFQQNLGILTMEELKTLNLLIQKLEQQDASINVLNFPTDFFPLFIDDGTQQGSAHKAKGIAPTMRRTKTPRQDLYESMRVKPIQSTTIPG